MQRGVGLVARAVRVHGVDGRFYVGVLRDLCCFDVYQRSAFCGCRCVWRFIVLPLYAFRAIRAGSFRGGDVNNLAAFRAPRVSRGFGRRRAAASSRTAQVRRRVSVRRKAPNNFRQRRFCEPQSETLEFKGVGALMRRHRQYGGELLRERPYARSGGRATHGEQ